MNSRIYFGELQHRRSTPKRYQFTYGVYYLSLDLDEIPAIARRIVPFSYGQFNVLSFFDRDHMSATDSRRALTATGVPDVAPVTEHGVANDVRAVMHAHLAARGIDPASVRITLLTNPRVLGYVFNPVSFYFVRERADGSLRTVIAEVHNTHGECHVYDLDRLPGIDPYTARAEKAFYVSPFIGMKARYKFEFSEGIDGAYEIRLDEYDGDELFFQSRLRLSRAALTNANVARMLMRYPLVTLKTIALIHWQGLKLWLRGVSYQPWRAREVHE